MRYALVDEHVWLPQIREDALCWQNMKKSIPIIKRIQSSVRDTKWDHAACTSWTNAPLVTLPYQPPPNPPLALGILAADRQSYAESHDIYWSMNNFHLARGHLINSIAFFSNTSPKHIALIRHLTIDLSLADLTPPVLLRLEGLARRTLPGSQFHDDAWGHWAWQASLILWTIWETKLNWACKFFRHVNPIYTYRMLRGTG